MATSTKSKSTTAKSASKSNGAAKTPEPTPIEQARERVGDAVETAVDLPVGAALTVYDRFGEAVEPLSTPSKRQAELKRLRTQLRREVNKAERRGGTARRRALQRAKRTRNRLEREVKQQRRSLETTVRQNRRKAETELRKANKQLKENRDVAEKRVKELVERVQGESKQKQAA